MVAPNSESSQTKTRQQLLEAAGPVFAEHGYRAATVREICLRAGANVASIHYHFGDKEKLYLEVLRYAQLLDNQTNPGLAKANRSVSPEEQLKGFIRSFLVKLLSPGPVAWDGKLLAREMVEPSVGNGRRRSTNAFARCTNTCARFFALSSGLRQRKTNFANTNSALSVNACSIITAEKWSCACIRTSNQMDQRSTN